MRERGVFLFNQATQPTWYANDLNAILCFKVRDATLCLYDLVAIRVPKLQQVIDRIDSPLERVEVCFTPDQLNASLSPEPDVVNGGSWLMVRGEFPHWHSDLMLPSIACS
ncbi:MAG: hypothetical protein JSV78_00075 [Phycisphaerales bacterium]|nr:MAG: hypothetical protein JSV78_00075 [Phycisphaerales bacterium]